MPALSLVPNTNMLPASANGADTQNNELMEKNIKEMYCSPETKVFEVKTEGVICQSGDPLLYDNPFGDELSF